VSIKRFLSIRFAGNFFLLFFTYTTASYTISAQTVQFDSDEISHYQQKGIQPFISNEQDGDYPAGVYLVLNDLTIEKNKTMTLYPGSTLLMKKDSRIKINGKLICSGKPDAPVILRKLDDSLYYNPPDTSMVTWWDGMYLGDSASVVLSNTRLTDSKYGILARTNAPAITLDSVTFVNNKYHSLRAGEDIPNIPDNVPVSYRSSGITSDKKAIMSIDTIKTKKNIAKKATRTDTDTSEEITRNKKPARIIMGCLTVGGAALAAGSFYMHQKYYSRYDTKRDASKYDSQLIDKYKTRSVAFFWTGVAGSAIGGISGTGLILTFVF
jgi:hypothetical protein